MHYVRHLWPTEGKSIQVICLLVETNCDIMSKMHSQGIKEYILMEKVTLRDRVSIKREATGKLDRVFITCSSNKHIYIVSKVIGYHG